jgi:hypothetical protein
MSTGSGEVDANTAPKGSQKDSRTARLKHLERFKAEHPLSPDAQVDPKAAEMVQYYLQARKDHDFKLVDVRIERTCDCYPYICPGDTSRNLTCDDCN